MEGRVLAIGAHVDDIEVGAAGMLHNMIKHNDVSRVEVVYFTKPGNIMQSDERFSSEYMKAMQVWGFRFAEPHRFTMHYKMIPVREFQNHSNDIREYLWELNEKVNPDTVLVPSRAEHHQDHQVVSNEATRIFRHSTILGYEMPMISLPVECIMYYRLEDDDVAAKVAAIQAYKSQAFRASMQPGIMESLAKIRGNQCGAKWAEAYEVIRMIK